MLSSLPYNENIIQFIGATKLDNYMCLVFEFASQGDLTSYLIKNSKIIDLMTCFSILSGISNGLRILHSHLPAIIHRDLSSRNVFIDENLIVKIGDFGSSAYFENFLNGYCSFTTPEYIPPEIWIKNSHLSTLSDIYSFGIIITEIAMTHSQKIYSFPFSYNQFENYNEKIFKISLGISPELPSNINNLFIPFINECLSKEAIHRPNADELYKNFEQIKKNLI